MLMGNGKKIILLVVIVALILGIIFSENIGKNEDVIRIHIRANSDSEIDQDIMYKVRDSVIGYLSDRLILCKDKNEAYKLIKSDIKGISSVCDNVLTESKARYTARILVREEDMPTRQYLGYTLEQGIYDSLTIELGKASGEDWWCVAYPPICFNDKKDYYYRSRVKKLIEKYMPK